MSKIKIIEHNGVYPTVSQLNLSEFLNLGCCLRTLEHYLKANGESKIPSYRPQGNLLIVNFANLRPVEEDREVYVCHTEHPEQKERLSSILTDLRYSNMDYDSIQAANLTRAMTSAIEKLKGADYLETELPLFPSVPKHTTKGLEAYLSKAASQINTLKRIVSEKRKACLRPELEKAPLEILIGCANHLDLPEPVIQAMNNGYNETLGNLSEKYGSLTVLNSFDSAARIFHLDNPALIPAVIGACEKTIGADRYNTI